VKLDLSVIAPNADNDFLALAILKQKVIAA